ncbi:hypothetical protein ACFVRU_52675 [Streptomyces sp. NPDC057927]|uniref:hypothetical protein n=1 Tax=Streptomyces mirabilis TaxID=68239 RepID=UPI0036EC7083
MTDLLRFIDTAMSSSNDLEATLSAVCGSGRLREHLLASVKERASLTDTLCYRHPNGFIKMKLLTPGADAWSLRVHVWDRPVPSSDVHNHRWDFASCVVSGRLIETQFDLEREGGDTPVFRLSKDAAGSYHYTKDGVGHLREGRVTQREVGQAYTLDHRVLHRADPDGGHLVITVVLQGPDLTRTTTVVPAEVPEWTESRAITRLGGDEIADLMELVAERLVL